MLRAFNPMRFPEKGWLRTYGDNLLPLDLNFLQEDTFDERITFTRSSGGGRFMMLEVKGK